MQGELFTWQSLTGAETTRQNIVKVTSQAKREKYSQFLTPKATAELAASFFSENSDRNLLKVLDLGAGTGILSIAVAERYSCKVEITAIELDSKLSQVCDSDLKLYGIPHTIELGDVLAHEFPPIFDKVILNPPYKKMAAKDVRQKGLPVPCSNLYAAFVLKGISALKAGGELVAIIPRSWMNGRYFEPFRKYLLSQVSLDVIHVYESRTDVFKDTDVLQETMILKVSKRPQSDPIIVSSSYGNYDVPTSRSFNLTELQCGKDSVIKISSFSDLDTFPSLRDLGFCASTGKVVDYRVKDFLSSEETAGAHKLLYPQNFNDNSVRHPIHGKKAQWFSCPPELNAKFLIPAGCYVIVKRFSPKEDCKRLKVFVADFDRPVALENHLNFIHSGTPRKVVPLEKQVAENLAAWLNSEKIENLFKAISGSTQVNASDLNNLPVPRFEALKDKLNHSH